MKRRHVLIAKRYSNNEFFMKVSNNNQDMVSRSEMIFHKNIGNVITHVIEKESGHRYLLDIRDADHPKLNSNILSIPVATAVLTLLDLINTLNISIVFALTA